MINDFLDKRKEQGDSIVFLRVGKFDDEGFYRVLTLEDDTEADRIEMLLRGLDRAREILNERLREMASEKGLHG